MKRSWVPLIALLVALSAQAKEVKVIKTTPSQVVIGVQEGKTTTLHYVETTQPMPPLEDNFDGVVEASEAGVIARGDGRLYHFWFNQAGTPEESYSDWREARSTAKAMATVTYYGNLKAVMSEHAVEMLLIGDVQSWAVKCVDGKVTEDDECSHGGPGSPSGSSPGFTCATMTIGSALAEGKKTPYISMGVICAEDYYPCGSCSGLGSHTCKKRAC